MAERHSDSGTTERHETVDPENPPNVVLRPEVRSAAFWLYLGPLIVIIAVVGIALAYWMTRDAAPNEDVTRTIGTAGDTPTPGGGDPDQVARPDDTREELKYRGAGDPSRGPMPGLSDATPLSSLREVAGLNAQTVAGRRIDVQNVVVVDARQATMFRVQDGDASVVVMAPPQSPAVRAGTRVDVSGVVEPDGQGGVRIRATRVNTR